MKYYMLYTINNQVRTRNKSQQKVCGKKEAATFACVFRDAYYNNCHLDNAVSTCDVISKTYKVLLNLIINLVHRILYTST